MSLARRVPFIHACECQRGLDSVWSLFTSSTADMHRVVMVMVSGWCCS